MRKYLIAIILIICIGYLSSCGDAKIINGKYYTTYGVLNKEEYRDPDIKYKIIMGNVLWSCFLIETIVLPVYFIGFSLYEPVGLKQEEK